MSGFHLPDAPGILPVRTPVDVSAAIVDLTFEKAQVMWPNITQSEVAAALGTDFAADDSQRALALLGYYAEARAGTILAVNGYQRAHSGSSSMLAQTKNLFSFDRKTKNSHDIKGSQNYSGVTCYIDSTLSAMFSRMENFEPLLYQQFDSRAKNDLATWLRMFVNMQRSGELITKDIMRSILVCCYQLGWCNNPNQGPPTMQQDAGEFFSFLTESLHMPLLSLRVDIAHAGREVAEDDHKVVTEQLLYLPVPGTPSDEPILLEECLELYFANNISVSRPFEPPLRRSTVGSAHGTPDLSSPRLRHRSYSIVSQQTTSFKRFAYDDDITPGDSPGAYSHHRRQSSTTVDLPSYTQLFGDTKEVIDRKNQLWTNNNEITFPAWMFLQLMPFYASPVGDVESLQHIEAQQVASHFERTRPVLAMCLKRFGCDESGNTILNNRKVIIPHTIYLPSFVADDSEKDEVFGSFKLVLESVVFHKGATNHSGHYTALVRDDAASPAVSSGSQGTQKSALWRRKSRRQQHHDDDQNERWLLLDDWPVEGERVQTVDFQAAMDQNMPYLLFYRMVSLQPMFKSSASQSSSKLSPINSPPGSAPVSPNMPASVGTSVVTSLGTLGTSLPQMSSLSLAQGSSANLAPSSAASLSVPHANQGLPVPPGHAQAAHEKKKKGLFRKHKEKDYASAYREEKCSLM